MSAAAAKPEGYRFFIDRSINKNKGLDRCRQACEAAAGPA
ncbi:hypothetical protein C7S17_7100 [Burkholderia thailandensis]|nr:hypothetical protein [Burkholderia thailandensis]